MENKLSRRGIFLLARLVKSRLEKFSFPERKEKEFCIDYKNKFYSLQLIANEITHHYGLYGYATVIIPERLKNAAGSINLNFSKDVFINIDKNASYTNGQYISIIAHEIAHKFLYVNNIYYEGQKNEFVTDAAAVYAGFGQIMREACYVEDISYSYSNDSYTDLLGYHGPSKRTKHIRTTTIGYLERWQIDFLIHCFSNDYIELHLFTKYFYFLKPKAICLMALQNFKKKIMRVVACFKQ